MNSFTVELVSNASFDCYPNNTLSSFTNFLPEQINLEGEWEVAITELSYPSLYQNITEGKFFYLDEATPNTKPSDYYTLDPGLYPSISDIVNEMNKKVQEREKYEKTPIRLHVNKITQRISLSLPNENSLLVIFSTDLCHVFGCEEAVYGMGVFMSGAGPHFPKFPYDIVRIHTLMIYSDIVEYNIVGDTKAALLRCIPFISKVKNGDIISTGQYMNYQNFPNLQFKKILKNSFHSIKLELRDSYGEKVPFNSVGVTRAVLMFRKTSENHF